MKIVARPPCETSAVNTIISMLALRCLLSNYYVAASAAIIRVPQFLTTGNIALIVYRVYIVFL